MTVQPLAVGADAPDFRAPSSHGQTLDREAFVGKVAMVLLFPPADGSDLDVLQAFDDRQVDFGHDRVQLLAVLTGTARMVRELAEEYPLRSLTVLADGDGSIRASFGVADAGRCLLVDREGSLQATVDFGTDAVDELLDRIEASPDGAQAASRPIGQ